jgi:hypothetical protein
LQWQRAEDPHGNPFVAIVVDPLRSLHLSTPAIKAFRAYPPEYQSPTTNECPNGRVEHSETVRLEHWGSCWNRYYELECEYFMSSTSRTCLERLTQDYLWIRTLESKTTNTNMGDRLVSATKQGQVASNTPVPTATVAPPRGNTARGYAGRNRGPPPAPPAAAAAALLEPQGLAAAAMAATSTASNVAPPVPTRTKEWKKAVQEITSLASEQLSETHLQSTKERIFFQ